MHGPGGPEGNQQNGQGEEFRAALVGDLMKQRPQQPMARRQNNDECGRCLEQRRGNLQGHELSAVGGVGNEYQEGDDRQVLKQEGCNRVASRDSGSVLLFGELLDDDDGR